MPPTVLVPLTASGETDPYDFGTLRLNERKSVTFHFQASGQHTLRVLGHDSDGQVSLNDVPASSFLGTLAVPHNFEVEYVDASALPGEEIKVKATFIAQRAGVHQGKFWIFVNAANLNAIVIPIRARVESFALVLVQPAPATLDLGRVPIDETKTVPLIIRNDATMVAWLTGVSFSNPTVTPQIGVETGPISIGQVRTFTLSYRPAYVGPIDTDVILHFTDGVSPSQHSQNVVVKLAAIGVGAQARLQPGSLDFGDVPVGAESTPRAITVTNIGLDPLTLTGTSISVEFRLVGATPVTLLGGQSAQIAMVFRPIDAGPRTSSFTIASNSLHPPTPVLVYGVGVVEPVLRATPDRVVFLDTVAGSTRTVGIVVSNPGAIAVSIGTVSVQPPGGADFQIVRDTCAGANLAPGQSCGVDVVFGPPTPGLKMGAVEVTGPTQPLLAALSGDALPALGLVPNVSDVDFGALAIGATSSTQHVILTNRASTPATIASVAVVGPAAGEAHVVTTDCRGAVLQPGASCSVQLQFKPGTLGPRVATLTANANVISHDASLRAIGLGAAVQWWLNPLEFGNAVIANQTPAQDTSLRNIGNALLTVLNVDVIDHATDFVITELTPGITSLAPNGELGFRIRFRPTATGDRRAYLRIHTDSPASPHVLSLWGVGFNPR